MPAEGEARLFGNTVRIGRDRAEKSLNLLRGLRMVLRQVFTWLDVMLHFRLLHPLRASYGRNKPGGTVKVLVGGKR